MVEDPVLEKRVAMHVFCQLKLILHSELVCQRNTNQVHKFLQTVLPAVVEAAPDAEATAEMRKKQAELLKDFVTAMELNGRMAKKAKDASIRRRELEECEEVKKAMLMPKYKRKSPKNKVNMLQMQASLVCWLLTVDLIIHSPSKNDEKQRRDHWTGARLLDREGNYEMQKKYYCKMSKNLLWLEAQRHPDLGGWPDLFNEDGTLRMKKTRFDSLTPGYFKQFTKSQMKMCTCKDCENAKLFSQAKVEWSKLNNNEMVAQLTELEEWMKSHPKTHLTFDTKISLICCNKPNLSETPFHALTS